jgi:hypothetical protein
MLSSGPLFILSLSLFSVYAIFVTLEQRRGKRFLLGGVREKLDNAVLIIYSFAARWLNYLGRHIIQLSWYYSIHRFLRMILTALVKSYDRLELIFLNNKARARVLKMEKKNLQGGGHLQQVSDHKAQTSLTASQKKKLKAKKLERE